MAKSKKPPMTPTERRQLNGQKALLAIVESDDDLDTKLAELARVRAFLDRLWTELEDAG